VSLSEEEYIAVLGKAAADGVSGVGIYDAIIGRCAMKAKAQAIYT
jgi:hypothetical protein